MKVYYDELSRELNKKITNKYSTSFSLGIRLLHSNLRQDVYSLYGYVRLADEIVDTFHDYDKATMLEEFRQETFRSIERGISVNPVVQAFQETVNKNNISHDLIDQFLVSMEMDLNPEMIYDTDSYNQYIYGSAEVVGLMCLKIFLEGDEVIYEKLKSHARSLGSAFQKINFLRDVKQDFFDLGRTYFPDVDFNDFTQKDKDSIEDDIEKDFQDAFIGIKQLPKKSRFGVYLAYVYYYSLFSKIKSKDSSEVLNHRIRVPNNQKYSILFTSYIRNALNLI
jgi:15-cis-phytoene synthase